MRLVPTDMHKCYYFCKLFENFVCLVVEILTTHPATTEGDVLTEDEYIQHLPSNHAHK